MSKFELKINSLSYEEKISMLLSNIEKGYFESFENKKLVISLEKEEGELLYNNLVSSLYNDLEEFMSSLIDRKDILDINLNDFNIDHKWIMIQEVLKTLTKFEGLVKINEETHWEQEIDYESDSFKDKEEDFNNLSRIDEVEKMISNFKNESIINLEEIDESINEIMNLKDFKIIKKDKKYISFIFIEEDENPQFKLGFLCKNKDKVKEKDIIKFSMEISKNMTGYEQKPSYIKKEKFNDFLGVENKKFKHLKIWITK